MSKLAERRPVAPGVTTPKLPPPQLPGAESARQFYLYGPVLPVMNCWVVDTSSAYAEPEPVPDRLAALLNLAARELLRLRELRPGWDGRQARPITPWAVYTTIRVLAAILDESSEPPQFFPLLDGGIQVEWYADDEIEIHVDAGGKAYVLATTANGDTLAEGPFDPQAPGQIVRDVAKYLKEFSARVAEERQRQQ